MMLGKVDWGNKGLIRPSKTRCRRSTMECFIVLEAGSERWLTVCRDYELVYSCRDPLRQFQQAAHTSRNLKYFTALKGTL